MSAKYLEEELKGRQLEGFKQAKELHAKVPLFMVKDQFKSMPASAYSNGGMKYVFNAMLEEGES